jgi:anaerobic magnesium-protoporphyrin IX monomethyl ester cyclase
MTDCLIIGFNDSDFTSYVEMVKSMGEDSGAYRDLALAFVDYEGKPHRSMDILNRFYYENKSGPRKLFNNADFLWPVVTYLSTYLTRRGLSSDYINLFHVEKEQLREKLLKNDILTVAITTTLYVSAHPILEIISFIREHNRTARIVLGGPYISNQVKTTEDASLQEMFQYLGADFYVTCQEGELALVNLIRALKNQTDLHQVDNIAYRNGAGYVMTKASIESNPLEENLVDYSLFPPQQIDQFVTTRTAKSCPFSCSFCGFPQRAGKYKYLSTLLVEKELDAIRDVGTVTTLTFIDDTFNVPKERFKEIMRLMIEKNYGFKWNIFYRSDHGDAEAIELMGKAGCEGVFLGIESGSDRMLKGMNKTASRKDYMKAIPLLRDAGVSTYASLIIGFPGETYETVQETISLIEEAKPDFYRAQLWYADPVTPIWNKRDEYGIKGSAFNWSHNTMDAATACDLIDKMFLCIEHSIWLPQFGFEQWSTFYLQRHGMTMEQIKTFLQCFNAVIKQRLLDPQQKEIEGRLLQDLRTSAQFDRALTPEMKSVEALAGARYLAAERFWIEEFRSVPAAPSLGLLREDIGESDEGHASVNCSIDREIVEQVQASYQIDASTLMLAAYNVLLYRTTGQEHIVMVAAATNEREVGHAVPFRMSPAWNQSFKTFAQQVRQKLDQAAEHQPYGFHLLTNPLRLAEHHVSCPIFDAGFLSSTWPGARGEVDWSTVLETRPDVREAIDLTLTVDISAADLTVQLVYAKNHFKPATVEKLAAYLQLILNAFAENPDVPLGEIVFDSAPHTLTTDTDAFASEVFNF